MDRSDWDNWRNEDVTRAFLLEVKAQIVAICLEMGMKKGEFHVESASITHAKMAYFLGKIEGFQEVLRISPLAMEEEEEEEQ